MHKPNIIKIIEDAAVKAGRALIRDFGELENLQVSRKGVGDFVTSADHKSEKILIRELQKARPDYGFLLEESGIIEGSDISHRWIVDPLDGTTNFMHGIPHFCISIALEEINASGKAEIIAAVTYAPALGEVFWAEKTLGTYDKNNRRLSVSGRNNLEESLIGTYLWHKEGDFRKSDIEFISDRISNIRVLGSSALELAYVAAGKLDGFWYTHLKPWDMAAGILLVREAHGMVSEIDGGQKMLKNGNILATNSRLNDEMLSILGKHYRNSLKKKRV